MKLKPAGERASQGRRREGEKERDLDGNLVDFIERVDGRHVDTIALDDVDELVAGGVTSKCYVCVVNLVFPTDGTRYFEVQLALRTLRVHGDPTYSPIHNRSLTPEHKCTSRFFRYFHCCYDPSLN